MTAAEESFPRRERLIKTGEFRRVYENGVFRRENSVVVSIVPNGLDYSRLGITVRSRIIKNAITRNRIKRLIRDVYRRNRGSMRPGLDIVVSVKINPDKTRENYVRMRADVLSAFKRSGLVW